MKASLILIVMMVMLVIEEIEGVQCWSKLTRLGGVEVDPVELDCDRKRMWERDRENLIFFQKKIL